MTSEVLTPLMGVELGEARKSKKLRRRRFIVPSSRREKSVRAEAAERAILVFHGRTGEILVILCAPLLVSVWELRNYKKVVLTAKV